MLNKTEIFNDVYKCDLTTHTDQRGYFSEIYKKSDFSDIFNNVLFIQDNLSYSKKENTIRGLHYQLAPCDQSKYVIVLKGKIWDVFVDLRRDSSTYLEYGFTELNANQSSLFIPKGFAHGFCTLQADTIVLYKVDNYYSKDHERGIIWNDKSLNIPWPINKDQVIISDKDMKLPKIKK